MKRRELLAAASMPVLAGCSGIFADSPSDEYPEITAADSGPPYYTKVNLSAPETVEAGQEFNLTLSVANTGGRTGNFTSSMYVGENISLLTGTARVDTVKPGTLKSVKLGPEQINRSEEITVKIPDHGTTTTVEIVPARPNWGDSYTLDGFEVQVTDISFQPSFTYLTDNGDRGLFAAESGSTLVFCTLSVRATEPTDSEFPSGSEFHLTGATHDSARLNQASDFQSDYAPDDVTLYSGGGDAAPGASRTGTLIFQMPADIEEPAIAWNHSITDRPEVVWQFDEEVRNRAQNAPDFELVSLDLPEEVPILSDKSVSARVRNTGAESATFHGFVQRRNAGDSNWKRVAEIEQTIEANSSASIDFTINEPYLGPSEYRLFPFSQATTVDFGPAQQGMGIPFTTPSGVEYRVSRLRFNHYFEYEAGYDSTEQVIAKSTNTFAIAYVSVENTDSESIVGPDGFSAIVDGDEYPAYDLGYSSRTLVEPVTGKSYEGGSIFGDESTARGWIAFEIPDDYESVSIQADLSNRGEMVVEWTGDQ
ncbi:hypothetical protein ACOZ4I_20395 (plasmid) [Haloarcula salina]|uniref:hypothetical protein n=1 Tax=Haloarcula salina TaxID=1429914 RepID=UPI003C7002FE